MAAEPKGQSTYRPSTIDVISREVRVGTVCVCVCVCVCACWRGGSEIQSAGWRGGIKRLRDLAISELKESLKIASYRRRKIGFLYITDPPLPPKWLKYIQIIDK